ncbi:MAG: winged helix DNA-binding protein [Kiloniellales bacterium]|nr:winged helix DNA-binding protein [Kiloniellales bacterium]
MSRAVESKRPIVSSAHLVSERSAELSEFEYGLIVASHALNRWMVRCMAAAGLGDLGPLDILVLHSVNHRGRDKKLADICFVLNVEDSHTVSYALRKLVRAGLVETRKSGKETFHATTKQGRAACERYRQVREDCLMAALDAFAGTTEGATGGDLNQRIGSAADLLRAVSGLYDQAARAASSL